MVLGMVESVPFIARSGAMWTHYTRTCIYDSMCHHYTDVIILYPPIIVDDVLFFSTGNHKGCNRVQDPYTLRCIPQVHGVVNDTLTFVKGIITTEMNSALDNPVCTCTCV